VTALGVMLTDFDFP